MRPQPIALTLEDELCYVEKTGFFTQEEKDEFMGYLDKGITETKIMGLPTPIGYASGHLILIGDILINGLTFEKVTMNQDDALKLLGQVTEQEVKEYEEIMEYRRDCLSKEVKLRIKAYVQKVPFESLCSRN
jgi:hypothetical protein